MAEMSILTLVGQFKPHPKITSELRRNNTSFIVRWGLHFSYVKYVQKITKILELSPVVIYFVLLVSPHGR